MKKSSEKKQEKVDLKMQIENNINTLSEEEKLLSVFLFKSKELELRELYQKGCVVCFVLHVLDQEMFNTSNYTKDHNSHTANTANKVIKAIKSSIKSLQKTDKGELKIGLLSLYCSGIRDFGFLFNKLEAIEMKSIIYDYMFQLLNTLASFLGAKQQEGCHINDKVVYSLCLEKLLGVDDKRTRGKFWFEKLLQVDKTLTKQLQKEINFAVSEMSLLRKELLNLYRKTLSIQKTGEFLNNKINYVNNNFLYTKEQFLKNLLSCWNTDMSYLSQLDVAPDRYEKSNNEGFIKLLQMWRWKVTSKQKTEYKMLIELFLSNET